MATETANATSYAIKIRIIRIYYPYVIITLIQYQIQRRNILCGSGVLTSRVKWF